ncbi:hypothetical protein, partial [uncultured Umboniibacter sp.]|uniref:hypothetical protein n=1 Tax=uncultured Umboniibacter sp. TaxID=1798917 RepID=UPI00262C696C
TWHISTSLLWFLIYHKKCLEFSGLIKQLESQAPKNVEFISLVGSDYYTKLAHCLDSTAFISYSGTPLLVPLRFCNKPGVIHSNRSYWNGNDHQWNPNIAMPKLEDIEEQTSKRNTKKDFINYTIEPQVIYQLLLDTLEKID